MMLREVGVETSNLYTGFLSIVLMLLDDGGELVAITPRSFCNGPYFKPFRKLLLDTVTIKRIHVFESRQVVFREDEVLQENVIIHGVRAPGNKATVTTSSSTGPEGDMHVQEIDYDQLVRPGDREYFIRIVADELGKRVAKPGPDCEAHLFSGFVKAPPRGGGSTRASYQIKTVHDRIRG